MRLSALLALTLLTIAPMTHADVMTPDAPVMHLDDLGLYQPGYDLRNCAEVKLPVGSTYGMDSFTGAACQPSAQNGREAWLLHCPWRGATGVSFQDFTFKLPASHRIDLKGYTALKAEDVGKSDGVTYRVYVDGILKWEASRTDATWQPFDVDMTAYAGKTATIRFETDPGPHDNPSFDLSLWGDRTLTIDGLVVRAEHHPPTPQIDLAKLRSTPNDGVVPRAVPLIDGVTARFGKLYLGGVGREGQIAYEWTPQPSVDHPLGTFVAMIARLHDTPRAVRLATSTRFDWLGDAHLLTSTATSTKSTAHMTSTYRVGDQTATVTVSARFTGKSLVLDIACDKPVIAAVDGGGWGPVMRRKIVNLPYCSYLPTYLTHENLFTDAFLDWTSSNASSHEGLRAAYGPKTDGTRNLLKERLIYAAAWTLDEALPNIPNPPSPYRQKLGRGVILDVWGGSFTDIGIKLHTLATEGIGPATALIHNWQRSGYDNALPAHVPANTDLGGDDAMKAMVKQAQRDGIDIALHENYVDYYPNYDNFTDGDIAKNSDGSRVPAWYNPGTKIQSFAVKPTCILELAATQSPEVVKRYGSSACYLDVHSAVPPWFHVDFDNGQNGAGEFSTVRDAHSSLWAYERQLHHGPVFGEGNDHWYWSGLLDGVEAQFGQGWAANAGPSAPLLVDFDLLKIHPLQLNHGMGYYERWWQEPPAGGFVTALDTYRMQEIAFGHEGFLGGDAWSNVPLALEEAWLVTPVTSLTSTADVAAIDYLSGGQWRDSSETAKVGGWSTVRVKYGGGIVVWANSNAKATEAGGFTVPRNGWLAKGPALTAGTVDIGGRVVSFSDTPSAVYVNTRPSAWRAAASGITPVSVKVDSFQQTGPRTFRVTYRWHSSTEMAVDYQCFVHITDPAGERAIRFQQDHALSAPTSTWHEANDIVDGPWDVTVPADLANGDYSWTIGLYNDSGRLALEGQDDGERRIVLGTLHVADGSVSFTPSTSTVAVDLPDRLVTVGAVRTDGCVDIRRKGNVWTLRTIPAGAKYTVLLNDARFGHPARADVKAGWWRVSTNGAIECRWPVKNKARPE